MNRILTGLRSGAAYAAAVFTFAFFTGFMRTVALAQIPSLTPMAAIAVELPFILGFAWFACGLVLRRMHVDPAVSSRVAMSIASFAGIISLELCLALTLGQSNLPAFLATYRTPEAQMGLAGQIVFACFPLLRARRS